MKCPKCNVDMETRNYDGLEVDRCGKCGGFFLDKGELEQIDRKNLGPLIDLATHFDEAEKQEADDRPAHCHRCDNAMFPLKGAGDIQFDWCDQCEGMFFDRGELAEIDAFEQ